MITEDVYEIATITLDVHDFNSMAGGNNVPTIADNIVSGYDVPIIEWDVNNCYAMAGDNDEVPTIVEDSTTIVSQSRITVMMTWNSAIKTT